MKNSLILICIFGFLMGCAQNPVAPVMEDSKPLVARKIQSQVLDEKKKQAELDLPFRGFPVDEAISTVALGSCADQDSPQPIWTQIEKNSPQLMIMLGDNVYASKPEQKPISDQYNKQKKILEYRSIREKVPFMATWDDHDYGQNDGGVNNPEKSEARVQFVKNWPYVKDLLQTKDGAIFHSKVFGKKKSKLQVILLDTRFDRSDLVANDQSPEEKAISPKPYLPNPDKKSRILSEEQWSWLEKQLQVQADFRILGSSIQLIANDHQFEKWGNFPHERERFFKLLKKHKIKNLVVVSGDRHMAAIAEEKVEGLGSAVFELTASAINRPARLGNNMSDSKYLSDGFGLVNFGLIKIDWNAKVASLEVHDIENNVVREHKVKF